MSYIIGFVTFFIACYLAYLTFYVYVGWAMKQSPEKRVYNKSFSEQTGEIELLPLLNILIDFEANGKDLTGKQRFLWHFMSLFKWWGMPIYWAVLYAVVDIAIFGI